MKNFPAKPHRSYGFSLSPVHRAALAVLAAHDGHGNPSRIVQDLIERAIEAQLGERWRDLLVGQDCTSDPQIVP